MHYGSGSACPGQAARLMALLWSGGWTAEAITVMHRGTGDIVHSWTRSALREG